MKIKIRSVHGQGDYENEYVILDVVEDCDIGKYLLSDTTYTNDGKFSDKLRHLYWFPDKDVKTGDVVVVYTKAGKNSSTTNANGTPVHYFYWRLQKAVWNDDGDCAVLIEVKTWKSHPAR
jgi:hypothetical protein